jgi:hypothetical protein
MKQAALGAGAVATGGLLLWLATRR